MRIAFVDPIDWDYLVESVYQIPLGGSQSALCYLSEALAVMGHDVHVLNRCTTPRMSRGVQCWSLGQPLPVTLFQSFDAVVALNVASLGQQFRSHLRPTTPMVMWTQHASDQPAMKELRNPAERDAHDGIAVLSDWQRQQYLRDFGVDAARTVIMRNAISPAFENLFQPHEAILDHKTRPPVLAYTSTPFRGLSLLLDLFPAIRQAVPGIELKVFSSMKVYQMAQGPDETQYGQLYRRCRETPGVRYVGSLPQPELAREIRAVSILAYPNVFAETFCIAALEALASGCAIVTSELGALPETTAGFGELIPLLGQTDAYPRRFIERTIEVLGRLSETNRPEMEKRLRRQVDQVNQTSTWALQARRWLDWLPTIPVRNRGATSGPAPVASGGVAEMLTQAVRAHREGNLPRAEQLYRQILQMDPRQADAMHGLGLLAGQAGRHDLAVQILAQAVTLAPNNIGFHLNLAIAHRGLGRLEDAETVYRKVLTLDPNHADTLAELGTVLASRGRRDEAVACFRQALACQPKHRTALGNLASLLAEKGQVDEAATYFQQAVEAWPDLAEGHHNLGLIRARQGRLHEAATCFRQALERRPDLVEAWTNLGATQLSLKSPAEAEASFRQALRINPNHAQALANLGVALKDQGRLDEALVSLRRAVEVEPHNATLHDNLLHLLHYLPNLEPPQVFAEHQEWARRHASIQPATPRPRSGAKPLRVGYVSPDFRGHVVASVIEPVLQAHDRSRFHVTCYANVAHPDDTTQRLQGRADRWRNLWGVTDEAAADLIRQDEIDVLVDLAGHTANNRLPLFAKKPAPLQATLFGYPASTGLKAVDFRLTDAFADPTGLTETLHSERLLRLPEVAWCWSPPRQSSAVSPLPASKNGHLAFGSLNQIAKVNAEVVKLWARILREVPTSRLVILTSGAGSGDVRIRDLFVKEGINSDRIEVLGQLSTDRYFERYGTIDLALDPFPYNGGVTTCDALWMGVPVLTLAGKTYAARQGVSLLSNVGLPEWIAQTPDQYVDMAKRWAGDLPRLAELRSGLRERLSRSPVMDGVRYTRNLEAAFLQMIANH